ncbi:hypothetical protein QUQ52_000778 [Escherichia coli]|nr:hypothetical protein [Escherichia coli]
MSEYQDNNNIYEKEYSGFFTEDAVDDFNDVVNAIELLATLFDEINGKSAVTHESKHIAAITKIIYRELQSIKSGLHLSGGIFSWHEAEARGLIKHTDNIKEH